jgi:hypothetical protein
MIIKKEKIIFTTAHPYPPVVKFVKNAIPPLPLFWDICGLV